MKTHRFVFSVASLALAAAAASYGQADAPTVTLSGPTDRLSESTTKAVAAGISFNPPKPVEKKPEPVVAPDDKPQNDIPRLPEYIVHGERPPIFRPRDIYTKKGLGEFAVNKYLSEGSKALNRFTLPLVGMGKESIAQAMYEDDVRQENLKEANQSIYILRQTDSVGADQLKKEVDQTFIRRTEFSPVSNNSSRPR